MSSVMAFVNSFTIGHGRSNSRGQLARRSRPGEVRACDKRGANEDDNSPPQNRPSRREFQPFDGSRPLLPPWKPPSVEAEFNYTASRIVSRERRSETKTKKLVKVESEHCGTLFAEVVQETNETNGKIWLRPLILKHSEDATFVDLRGGSDLVLSKKCVAEVEAKMKTNIEVNMMVTEGDVLHRALSDERWNEAGSSALIAFMRGLSEEGNM